MSAGRPSLFSESLIQDICDRLSEGEPLAEICRSEGYPNPSTIRRWITERPDISSAIADAREDGEDRITANIRKTAKGEEGFSSGDVVRDKLIIETDLKLLAKWNPRKYGEQQERAVEVGNSVQLIIMPSGTSEADLERTIDVPRLSGIVSESGA